MMDGSDLTCNCGAQGHFVTCKHFAHATPECESSTGESSDESVGDRALSVARQQLARQQLKLIERWRATPWTVESQRLTLTETLLWQHVASQLADQLEQVLKGVPVSAIYP